MKNVLTKDKILEIKYTYEELENYLSFLKDAGFIEYFEIAYRHNMDVYWFRVDDYEGYLFNKDDVRKGLIEFFKIFKYMKEFNQINSKEVNTNER